MDATNRKLVEDAARAAGYVLGRWDEAINAYEWRTDSYQQWWNPAEPYAHGDCMGDALRMATKLRITINQDWKTKVQVEWRDGYTPLYYYIDCTDTDRAAATRRAIVRAAAEIGGRTP